MQQKGLAFIEVLISLFVLSIGLLGLALLQVNALKQQHESEYRILAVSQIDNIADRMRANPAGVSSGAYQINSTTPTSCNPCIPAQLANQDVYQWNQMNAQLLPAGQGQVTALGNNSFDIVIRWDGLKTGATGTACSGNSSMDLTCMSMRVQL